MRKTRLLKFTALLAFIMLLAGCSAAPAASASEPSAPAVASDLVSSVTYPGADSRLSLVEKEYTIAQLLEMNIRGVIVTGPISEKRGRILGGLPDNVVIQSGGDVLKIQYYELYDGEYQIDSFRDGGGTYYEIGLYRTSSPAADEPERTITVTIPDNADLPLLFVDTSSGNISVDNCGAIMTSLYSDSGTVTLKPNDDIKSYYLSVDTAAGAGIQIGGETYKGGKFSIGEFDPLKRINLEGGAGGATFLIEKF